MLGPNLSASLVRVRVLLFPVTHLLLRLLHVFGLKNVRPRGSIFSFPASSSINVSQCPSMLVSRVCGRLKVEAPPNLQSHMSSKITDIPKIIRLPLEYRDNDRARRCLERESRFEESNQQLCADSSIHS